MDSCQIKPPSGFGSIDGVSAHRRETGNDGSGKSSQVATSINNAWPKEYKCTEFECLDTVAGLFGFSDEEQLQRHMLDHTFPALLDGNTRQTPLESKIAHWTPPLDARGMPRIPDSTWKFDGLDSPAGPRNQAREGWEPEEPTSEEDASQEDLIEGLEGLGLGIDGADVGGYDGEGYEVNLEGDLDEDDYSESQTFPQDVESHFDPLSGQMTPVLTNIPHVPWITVTAAQPQDGGPRGNLEQGSQHRRSGRD
ncbi:hypothetical protein Z517_09232 [Fonsecaea pedrosoi CBS 271.37]|uniref:Uncharacterized protein n=1 Tax=Fonsecaea pedrosoi CBS 271.37 TaxID=1442368 RepID=A0A0D2G7X6_9EURO|nr:uncharacterized protein Z517_09232 [Fonsecaea pedrosoi CBS 271.37]KIW76788.1 hypothetical protein Z517_09232 [Fonsecaea pedrosoi CBS 271.37]